MRVGTANYYQRNLFELQRQQSELDRSQQELSTGKKLIHPSDDPVGVTSALIIKRDMEVSERFLKAQDTVKRFQIHEETVLSSMTDAMFRVQELAISAQNGALTAESLNAISIEIQQLERELLGLANAKNASGDSLFSGYRTNVVPYSEDTFGQQQYQGDSGERDLLIGPSFNIQVNDPGNSFIDNVPANLIPLEPTAGVANSPGEVSVGFVTDPDEYVQDTYTINFFDNAGVPSVEVRDSGGIVVPLSPDSAVDHAYIAGDPIVVNGITVEPAPNPAPQNLDNFVMTPKANDETSLFWVLDQVVNALDVTGGKFTSAANAANTGTGNLVGGEIVNTDTFVMDDYTVNIIGVGQLEVRDSSNNVVLPTTNFVSGESFDFNGIEFTIGGAPNIGDSFNIDKPENDRRATILSNLQIEIDQGIKNIDNIRSDVGSRLNVIDREELVQLSFKRVLIDNLTSLEDIDIYEAITNLELSSTGLQAAQQSFAKIQNLSLFNYIR